MRGPVWKAREIARMRAAYRDTVTAELAAELGRTVKALHAKATALGLHKPPAETHEGKPCGICGCTSRRRNGICARQAFHAERPRGGIPGVRMAAKLAGERKYVGTPCKHCGGTVRYTRNKHCIDEKSHWKLRRGSQHAQHEARP